MCVSVRVRARTCVCVCARLYIRTYITRVLHVQCNPAVSAGMWKRKHAAYQQRQKMQRRSRVGFTRPFYKCFFLEHVVMRCVFTHVT